jgi:DNA-binding NarL/FixJ family response regulator
MGMDTRERILIIDDERSFTDDLVSALKAKHEVVVASSPVQAQEMVWAARPDMVVLGTLAPRGEAFRLHQWLKQTPQFADLPIMVIDAPIEKQLLQGWSKDEGMRLDADDYLAKPLDVVSILPRVEKMLDRSTRRIKVLVVDDHAIIREGIRALLALQRDMHVVGEAVNGQEALEKTLELSPDVVVMDIVMPVMNGLEATKRIRSKSDQAKVLMLSQYDDEENVLASSQAGAIGFVPKKSAGAELLDGIRTVSQGQRFVHHAAA